MRAAPNLFARLCAFFAIVAMAAQPVAAQSILRDAETEALLRDMAEPLVEVSGLDPQNVDIVLVNDPSINAFVAGGQVVYIHTGLIEAADTAEEVQGVIAHELGHITGGHINRYSDGIGDAANISILSMLLGAAAVLAGAGEAGMGILAAGQQAAQGKFLSFSRVQEASADAAGAQFLSDADMSGRGSLNFFKKLQSQEFRYGVSQNDDAAFGRTHPLSGDRIARLRETYTADAAWENPADPAMQNRFERVKAKLFGYQARPGKTLLRYPETRQDIPARYARAYAYHKNALIDEALEEADALITIDPADPYFLELKGQVLLESGRPTDALEPLRKASALTRNEPLIASMFGHALIATEDKTHFEEAEQVLRAAVARDRYNPFAWYQLGVVYAARGDMPRARLASAEQQVMSRQYAQALRSARFAENGLPKGSPDWIRAQDIGLQARAELERMKEDR
ncbi:MAG: M48 family metalloprotease [Pontixanthobacter sp.]